MPKFQLAEPLLHFNSNAFKSYEMVTMELGFAGVEIYYTLDGSEPGPGASKYDGPVKIAQTCVLKVAAYKKGWLPSDAVSVDFIRIKYQAASATLAAPPSPNYPGNGAASLIDLKTGSLNFRDGCWLGYEAQDVEATIDMGGLKTVRQIFIGCLSDNGSWIFLPRAISVAVSQDGEHFSPAAMQEYPESKGITPAAVHYKPLEIKPQDVRYIRVSIKNQTTVPDWHPGAGEKAWVFVDEVIVA